MLFVQQGRAINDSIAETNTWLFQKQADILCQVESLCFHLTEKGEPDERYKKNLTERWIADLFYHQEKKKKERELSITQAIT